MALGLKMDSITGLTLDEVLLFRILSGFIDESVLLKLLLLVLVIGIAFILTVGLKV
jgi:hypothetical protein